jgi:DNA-binding transcriptional LysR family regulator
MDSGSTFVARVETIRNQGLERVPMDIDKLACFVVLAEEEHFGRAAARLGLTTSAMSKRCATLELQLGFRLFERTSRQVRLTPAGRALVEGARRVIAAEDAFQTLVSQAARGRLAELVIAYSPGNGELVGRMIRELRSGSPELQVRLEQRLSSEIGATVLAGEASVGICRERPPAGLLTLTVSSRMIDCIVMPADHRLAALVDVGPADLDGETLLASRPHDAAVARHADFWRAKGTNVAVRYERWVTETQVMDSVVAGFGLVALDHAFLARNPRPGVVCRPLAPSLVPIPVEDYLVWRADDTSPVVRQFVAVARTVVAQAEAVLQSG